jgi:hypothetical protein
MSGSWWSKWRRPSEKPKKRADPKEKPDPRLSETRRIVRQIMEETRKIAPPKERPCLRKPPTITEHRGVTHVCFHKEGVLFSRIFRVDPITKTISRVAKRFDKSSLFYNKDGALIDDWLG